MRYEENTLEELNMIYNKSSESMEELPDNSVHIMVTSPPYNACKAYDEDLALDDYLLLLKRVFRETFRVLVPGGRACINIANLGRKPYIPLNSYMSKIMQDIGFSMRGEIIWDKKTGGGTAWGSWMSPSNPVLRDQHEYFLVFSKKTMGRSNISNRKITITKDEFLEFTRSIWTIPPASAKKTGHPAPFPTELPYRCIQLYTYQDEIVLDPFMGSGSTAIAALNSKRKYIGYEIYKEYLDLADQRILKEAAQLKLAFD